MINKIIFSQWTKPANNWTGITNNFGWLSEKYAWFGLALAAFYARYALKGHTEPVEVEFYTDNYGAEMANRFGIPFNKVDTCLQDVNLPASMWSSGKFVVIKKQTEPFLHIDGDVFLTRQLPANYLTAPVLYQSVEPFVRYTHYYNTIGKMLKSKDFKKTLNLEWGMGNGTEIGIRVHEAFNTGVIGGTDLDFLHAYADEALFLVEKNTDYWPNEPDILNSVVIEQWLLAILCRRNNKKAVNLIWEPEPETLGYHHYIASSKRRAEIVVPMAMELKRLQPEVYKAIDSHFQYSEQCNPIGGQL